MAWWQHEPGGLNPFHWKLWHYLFIPTILICNHWNLHVSTSPNFPLYFKPLSLLTTLPDQIVVWIRIIRLSIPVFVPDISFLLPIHGAEVVSMSTNYIGDLLCVVFFLLSQSKGDPSIIHALRRESYESRFRNISRTAIRPVKWVAWSCFRLTRPFYGCIWSTIQHLILLQKYLFVVLHIFLHVVSVLFAAFFNLSQNFVFCSFDDILILLN